MSKTGMTKAQVIEWAKRHGWTLDRYGHMRKSTELDGKIREYRLKLQDISFRREVLMRFDKQEYSPAHSEWVRVGGGYYKDAHLTVDDKLSLRPE